MSRSLIQDQAERHGWRHLQAWYGTSIELNSWDDYFVRGRTIVRVKYDKAERVSGAHRWERGEQSVERLCRLTPGKANRVIGWIHVEPLRAGR